MSIFVQDVVVTLFTSLAFAGTLHPRGDGRPAGPRQAAVLELQRLLAAAIQPTVSRNSLISNPVQVTRAYSVSQMKCLVWSAPRLPRNVVSVTTHSSIFDTSSIRHRVVLLSTEGASRR